MKKIFLSIALLCAASWVAPTVATAQNLVPIPLKMASAQGQPLVWQNVGQINCPDEFKSGKTKCARFEKRNVQKSGKTKRAKKFAHTTL